MESSLDRELRGRPDVGPAERAAVRVVARAIDRAEASADLAGVDALSKTYLALRLAAGLSLRSRPDQKNDPFEQLVAEITAGRLRDAENTGPP